jgi:hypothetical protein
VTIPSVDNACWDEIRDFMADHWIELHEYTGHIWRDLHALIVEALPEPEVDA